MKAQFQAMVPVKSEQSITQVIDVETLPQASYSSNVPISVGIDNGDKFNGGFGITELNWTDYWTLRARSKQLFAKNIYAYGIVGRLNTAIINTGLKLEAQPSQTLLGLEEEEAEEWSEMVENRFDLWSNDNVLCDFAQQHNFGQIQRIAYQSALISGDVLCVIRYDSVTKLPAIQLIDGASVQNPPASQPDGLNEGHKITWGVETDKRDRQVAYWVIQPDGKAKRLPAKSRTGRTVAFLVYGIDREVGEVRGKPLLSIILQSLKELDRYRDAAQRKAVINSILAMYIKKDAELMGSLPIQGAATRTGTVQSQAGGPPVTRSAQFVENHPGLIMQEMQKGETPVAHQNNGEIHYAEFEDAIVQACAWTLNIPPEILKLSFNSNYSASQAANAEFRIYTDQVRSSFGSQMCKPVYHEWMLSELMMRKMPDPGILDAWRSKSAYDVYQMWTQSDWQGAVKPSADIVKTAKGYENLVSQGFMTRDRATREATGTKYSKNVKKLKQENAQLAEANKIFAETDAKVALEFAPEPAEPKVEKDGKN